MIGKLGAPFGVFALAIAAGYLVPALANDQKASPPAPNETPLTYRAEGSDGSENDPAYLQLTAVGEPPDATRSFQLRESTGLHGGRVRTATADEAPECRAVPLRKTGLEGRDGAKRWCLHLSGLEVGYEVDGKVPGQGVGTGPSTVLALTASRRDAFRWRPFLLLVGGFLVGVVVGLLTPFASGIREQIQLGWLLRRRPTINCLKTWVEQRRQGGESEKDLLSVVAPIVKRGPAAAAWARRELLTALADLPTYPFVEQSRLEAQKTTYERSDFIDEEGTKVPHPATTWLKAVKHFKEIQSFLADAERRIQQLPQDRRGEPQTKLAQAQTTLDHVVKAEELSRMDARISDLRVSIENAESGLPRPAEAAAPLVEPRGEEPEPLVLEGGRLWAATAVAVVVTLIALAVTLAIAGFTLFETLYEPNKKFGLWPDEVGLAVAAFGSAGVAGFLSILLGWRIAPTPKVS